MICHNETVIKYGNLICIKTGAYIYNQSNCKWITYHFKSALTNLFNYSRIALLGMFAVFAFSQVAGVKGL